MESHSNDVSSADFSLVPGDTASRVRQPLLGHMIDVSSKGFDGVPASVHFGDQITFSTLEPTPINVTVSISSPSVAEGVSDKSLFGVLICPTGSTYTVKVGGRLNTAGSPVANVFTLHAGGKTATINVFPELHDLSFDKDGKPSWVEQHVRYGDTVSFSWRETSGGPTAADIEYMVDNTADARLFGDTLISIPSARVVNLNGYKESSDVRFQIKAKDVVRRDGPTVTDGKINVTK